MGVAGARQPSAAVVVTGASAGVGRAVAHAFARRGARLGLLARGREGLEQARRECEELGGEAVPLAVDVADAGQVESAAARLEEELGPIDVWVNNAMATVFAELTDLTAAEFERATQVTYLGTVYGTMAALRRMVPRDRGTVVQVGSALSYRAIPLQSAYCGAKFAIRGFSDSVRTELLHRGSQVWITMVQLPAVNTPQFTWCRTRLPWHPMPVPPIYQPELVAETIYDAAHQRRREVSIGGSAATITLANKVAPGAADRYLARAGYDSQQMVGTPVGEDRPDNLFEPVPDRASTHGIFDAHARERSYEAWLTLRRRGLAAALAGLLAGAGVAGAAARLRRAGGRRR